MTGFAFELYEVPGKDKCQACIVYLAEGEVTLPSGQKLQYCRSCVSPLRRALKSLFKRMEKRVAQQNRESGETR